MRAYEEMLSFGREDAALPLHRDRFHTVLLKLAIEICHFSRIFLHCVRCAGDSAAQLTSLLAKTTHKHVRWMCTSFSSLNLEHRFASFDLQFRNCFSSLAGALFLSRSHLCLRHAAAFARFGVIKWSCIGATALLCECNGMLPDANQRQPRCLFLNWCLANAISSIEDWTVDSTTASGARYNNNHITCLNTFATFGRNECHS